MEEFDYELLFHLLCMQSLEDEATNKLLTGVIEAHQAEVQRVRWEKERKGLQDFHSVKLNGEPGKMYMEYLNHEALWMEFLKSEGGQGSETAVMKRILKLITDMADPAIGYHALLRRKGFGEVSKMLAMLYGLRHRGQPAAVDARQVIKDGSENKFSRLPEGLFDFLFHSGTGEDGWLNHFNTIASESLTTGGSSILNLGKIYLVHDFVWGYEGPYAEGEEIVFNGHRYLLKEGKALII